VLLAAAVLVLGACGTVDCKPCASSVWVGIAGVGTDPARVLQVCVEGAPSCHQLHIDPITESSKNPYGPGDFLCGGATDHTITCSINGDTVYVRFFDWHEAGRDGQRVEVTATGGQSADQHGTGTFTSERGDGPCACGQTSAQVHLTPTS